MDLFGLVQTVVDLAKAHEEYGEEVKQFQMRLSLLQEHLQKLEAHNFQINGQLQGEIKRELTDSSYLLKKLPERSSVINTLLAKFPFGSVYNDIKEKSQALDRLSQQLNTQLITSLAVGQNNRPPTNQHFEETQIDMDQVVAQNNSNSKVQLRLVADEHIKLQFRKNIINTTEVIHLEFANNSEEMEVFKFGREYYRKLSMELVQTISREHAIITCTRKPKTKTEEEKFEVPQKKVKLDQEQQQQQQQQSAEVFYTCYDIVQQDVQKPAEDQNYDYTFKLQNKSLNCVFIYRVEETKKNEDDIILGTWTRVTPNKIITLKVRDKIAILMKKPEYKFPIIAYEFDVLL